MSTVNKVLINTEFSKFPLLGLTTGCTSHLEPPYGRHRSYQEKFGVMGDTGSYGIQWEITGVMGDSGSYGIWWEILGDTGSYGVWWEIPGVMGDSGRYWELWEIVGGTWSYWRQWELVGDIRSYGRYRELVASHSGIPQKQIVILVIWFYGVKMK